MMTTSTACPASAAAGQGGYIDMTTTSTSVRRSAAGATTITTLVNGPADHPTRPAPFIRVDTEK
jgi:hypothetical protein